MQTYVVRKDLRKFAIVIMVVGTIVLLAAVIKGIEVIVAFIRGIPILTFRDVSINVINVIFNFVIPFIGGSLLLIAGNTIMRINDEAVGRAVARRNIEAVRNERASVISRVLDKDEKGMLELIKGKDFVLQSDLMALTGYSKVKVHRVLKKLEAKGLIKRSRFGITNRVFANLGR